MPGRALGTTEKKRAVFSLTRFLSRRPVAFFLRRVLFFPCFVLLKRDLANRNEVGFLGASRRVASLRSRVRRHRE